MKIDIDQMSYDDLVDLNHRIVERLRFFGPDARAFGHAGISDWPARCFEPLREAPIYGTLTKYNRKTVTVVADNGQQRRVPPGLLRHAEADTTPAESPVRLLKND